MEKRNSDQENAGRPKGVVSLFSGAGGMDLGFEGDFDAPVRSVNTEAHPNWVEHDYGDGRVRLAPTGFRTVMANDIFMAAKTQWAGYFTARGADAESYSTESVVDLVKRQWEGERIFPQADLVTAGFPCPDFSLAGKRASFKSATNHIGKAMDPNTPEIENRGMLYHWMKEVITIVRPLAFVAENVGGMNSIEGAKERIQDDLSGAGYHVTVETLFAPHYGVPQTRRRIIFVGLREGAGFLDTYRYPEPTHFDPAKGGDPSAPRLLPYVTCREAFAGLAEPEESDDPSQKALSRGRCYGLSKAGRRMQGQNEVSLDRPGPTIRAEPHGNIEFRRLSAEHGGRNVDELALGLRERRLTVRECARLQTFPDDFQFMLPGICTTAAYRGVGNAVPPLLAYHIAQSLRRIWPVTTAS
jgi:DNA (cytosine-5)-methyltransferase 1